ncbi:putative membrane protein [Rhizomicrobium palustre]|uniref:Putative membrane protein n=1 Tax=Rhizomicrobium palustre TaxID=189966 RepID=A0A846N2D3_9PROT|nr:DUF1700 domain-containing protein [Rhizomicrobium palustre]NIK89382.1 putative membrane protein [Rhizomicrobium palustre]
MTELALTNDKVKAYIATLSRALTSVPSEERSAILAEIKSHIEDRSAQTGAPADEALESLGDPLELAAAYLDQARLEQAVVHSTHSILLVTILERAGRSLAAAALGFAALFLFLLSIGFAAVVVAKPILPEQTGFWVGPHMFAFAILDKSPVGHELLGYWIMPISLLCAVGSFLAARALTRLGGRVLLRKTRMLSRI